MYSKIWHYTVVTRMWHREHYFLKSTVLSYVSTDLVACLGRDARGWCGSVLPLSGSPGMAASVSSPAPSSCSGLLCAQWHPCTDSHLPCWKKTHKLLTLRASFYRTMDIHYIVWWCYLVYASKVWNSQKWWLHGKYTLIRLSNVVNSDRYVK